MKNLIKSNGISYKTILKNILMIPVLFTACTSSSYFKVTRETERKIEYETTPDRLIPFCVDLKGEDPAKTFLFMIHILDQSNRAFDAFNGNLSDHEFCEFRIKNVERILRKGKKIYLAGYKPFKTYCEKAETHIYTFPGHGTFSSQCELEFHFAAIANEHGDCFSAMLADEKPCPDDGFPIGLNEK